MQTPYRVTVAVTRDVANQRFSRFVRRALISARERGLTDPAIESATGVTAATFHRWQRGDFGKRGPQPESVFKFCDGLGIQRKIAADLLGWSNDEVRPPEPEPDIPPDVLELLRRLRDPNVPNREKEFIAETIKSLIARPKPNVGAAKR